LGKTSLLKSTGRPAGMESKISGSSTKMPVLMVSENTWPQLGFSRKRSMAPSSLVMTMPNSRGLSTGIRPMVAMAFFSSWVATMADRSMSVSTSPEMTRKRSFSTSMALRTLPAVPSGVSSVAYTIFTPNSDPSPK
jgi:hypothetical protein